jgi:hypothetical protein
MLYHYANKQTIFGEIFQFLLVANRLKEPNTGYSFALVITTRNLFAIFGNAMSNTNFRRIFFIPCLANPPNIQKWWFGIKNLFNLFSDLRPKKIAIFRKKINCFSLFLFHPPLHHLHCKYGAPKQAKHEKINVFKPVSYGAPKQAKHEKINVFKPVSEQNFIPE